MLDWFLSKISMLIFIVVMAGLLFIFSAMQSNILSQNSKVQAANSIARVIDYICNNCSVNYFFDKNFTISIQNKIVTVDGISRAFASASATANIVAKGINIYKKGGLVYAIGL